MPYKSKEDAVKHNNEFNRRKYDRISVMVQKGQKEQIRAAAAGQKQSVNAYIIEAITRRMEQEQQPEQTAAGNNSMSGQAKLSCISRGEGFTGGVTEKYVRLSDLEAYPIRFGMYDRDHGNLHFVLGIESIIEYARAIACVPPDCCNAGDGVEPLLRNLPKAR